MREIKGFKDHK